MEERKIFIKGKIKTMKKAVLGIIMRDWKLLLAMKKRGFGVGKYNWPWWKIEKWETSEQAMIREAKEEIWIDILKQRRLWKLYFYFEWKSDWDFEVDLFLIEDFRWVPIETEEMKPEWFDIDKIPYDKMWEDDKIWLPKVLNWEGWIEYKFYFWEDGKIKSFEKIY